MDIIISSRIIIEVCMEFTMIQNITLDTVDAEDFCSLLIKEWPLAPCTTPHPEYSSMVSIVNYNSASKIYVDGTMLLRIL